MPVDKLPSGIEVGFREPTMRDVADAKDLADRRKYNEDEALAFLCLEAVSHPQTKKLVPVQQILEEFAVRDNIKLANEMFKVKDHQAYMRLFYLMYTLSEDDIEEIKAKAKKLLSGGGEAASSSEAVEA